MKRTEVLERIQPMTDLKLRVIDTTHAKVGIADDAERGEIVVLRPGTGGKLVPFHHDGVETLGKFVGFPVSTTEKLSRTTASNVMTELLRRQEKCSVFIRNGEIVSVFRNRDWHVLKVERMLSILEQSIHLQDYARVLELEKHVARIEMVGERREVIPGSALQNDVIAGGIVLNFSPIGTVAPSIESYVERVWCTNGCTTPEMFGEYKYPGGGDGDEIWQWFRATARKAYNSVHRIAKHFDAMAGEPISPEDRAAILDSMLLKAGMRDEVAAAVRSEALTHPPTNAWEMMNLITWGSSHIIPDDNPKAVIRAQKSVKEFIQATSHERSCPMCHQRMGRGTAQLAHGDPEAN